MTSRERMNLALNHQQPDRVPLDFGGTLTTGIHASLVYRLRQELGLPTRPVRITDIIQMLGEVEPDLMEALEVDTAYMMAHQSSFGYPMDNFKEWQMFDGTPVLVPGKFTTTPDKNGDILNYPKGDESLAPSGRMPNGGYYFDAIVRQHPINEDHLNVEDNLEEFGPYSEEYLHFMEEQTNHLHSSSNQALIGNPGGTGLGDIAAVPGVFLEDPKGIRDIEEWYMSILIRKDYIKELFDRQTDIAVENLKMYKQAVGDKISVIFLCGTDFGAQDAPFISPEIFDEMYLPYYQKMTSWIHKNTDWKIFKHCCGSILPLIPRFIEAGFDILNPVQCSAKDMDAATIKERFGDDLTLWGGGVDTQYVLPSGTPDEVAAQVGEQIEIMKPGGGFVFNTIHNAQADVPVENFLAMLEAFKAHRDY